MRQGYAQLERFERVGCGSLATRPPGILGAAIVLPLEDVVDDVPRDEPLRHAVEPRVVERRGVDAVLANERQLGRRPVE